MLWPVLPSAHEGYHLVVGGGALGLFLAWDLLYAGSTSPQEPFRVGVTGRSRLVRPVHLMSAEAQLALDLPVEDSQDNGLQWIASRLQGISAAEQERTKLAIYVCLPPGAVEAWSLAAAPVLALGWPGPLRIVFMSNGLISESALAAWVGIRPTVELVRALVFAGFERQITSQGTMVTHNGGKRIVYGPVKTAHDMPPNGTSKRPSEGGHGRRSAFFDWVPEPAISQVEKSKFFVNLVLGGLIGPRLRPNQDFWAVCSDARLGELARQFCRLVPETGLAVEMVVGMVKATVAATGRNVNSVSLAWAAGRRESWEALVAQLTALVALADNDDVRRYFFSFVEECERHARTES